MIKTYPDLIAAFEEMCGPEVVTMRRGPWVHFMCPNPKCSDQNGHFGLNVERLWAHCFICGWSGNARATLKMFGKVADPRVSLIWRNVDNDLGLALPTEIPGYSVWQDPICSRVDLAWVVKKGIEYFKAHGLDHRSCEWGVSSDPALVGRIILPIRMGGKLQNYQARAVLREYKPKTLNGASAKGWVKTSDLLYNYDAQGQGRWVFICEGPADALRVDGVSVMGSTLSTEQTKLLIELRPSEVIVFFDSDAWEKTLTVADQVFRAIKTEVSVVRYTKDETERGADPCSVDDLSASINGKLYFKSRSKVMLAKMKKGEWRWAESRE